MTVNSQTPTLGWCEIRVLHIVFSLLKQGDKVYTEIVLNCKIATLQSIIKEGQY